MASVGAHLIALATVACVSTEPSTSPLDLRAAPGDTATVFGQVRVPSTGDSASLPLPGAIVELGRWQGGPYDFRDSLRGRVAATADDPRFRIVARAMTDHTGSFAIGGVPVRETFALRARPPAGAAYEVTYFASLFGVRKESPIWLRILLDSVGSARR
jgi:protocatechuate 3,4-dioxygenase beta subunit